MQSINNDILTKNSENSSSQSELTKDHSEKTSNYWFANFTNNKESLELYWSFFSCLNLKDSDVIRLKSKIYFLKRKILNSIKDFFTNYFLFYQLAQVTLKSKYLRNLSLTKKKTNLLMKHLIVSNPDQRLIVFLYPEMHSCWKECHWVNQTLTSNWKDHNRQLCQCFSNKRKHWKCQKKAHIHSWMYQSINTSQVQKATQLSIYSEKIPAIFLERLRKLCYNMKDWKNLYLYPSEYVDFGWRFPKKWYWHLDTETFLKSKETRKARNLRYKSKIKAENQTPKPTKNQRKKNLLKKKYYYQNKLKKLAWSDHKERGKLTKKIEQIKFNISTKNY